MDKYVGDPAELRDPPAPARASRTRLLWLTILIMLALAGGSAWWWMHRQPAPQRQNAGAQRGEQAQSVGIATVGTADIPITYDGLGTVTSLATVTVKTQINGQLTEVAYKEGQLVKKGDFLAQIDPRPYQVALEQAQGALQRDQAALANARIDLTRYQKLNSQDSIARQQLDTQQATVRQDEGTVQADQGQIDSAKLNLTYCHITSPVDGRVGLRQVDAGNYVQTSDATGIVVITQLQPISVIFTQPEDRLPAMTAKIKAGTPLSVSVYDRAFSKKLSDGTVETIDNQIDTTTGTVKIRAMFPNTDDVLFPNQFVNVRLLLDTLKDATVVPSSAVQIGAQGSFVYVVKDDETVAVREIKPGPAANEKTAVLDGLKPGERVVTDGVDRLHEGAKVRLPDQANSAGGGNGQNGGGAPNADKGAGPAVGERRHRRNPEAQGGVAAPAGSGDNADAAGQDGTVAGQHRHRRRDGASGGGSEDRGSGTQPAEDVDRTGSDNTGNGNGQNNGAQGLSQTP